MKLGSENDTAQLGAALMDIEQGAARLSQGTHDTLTQAIANSNGLAAPGLFNTAVLAAIHLEEVQRLYAQYQKLSTLRIAIQVSLICAIQKHLTPGPDESICYLEGMGLESTRVITSICPVEMYHQSPVRAKATPESCARALEGIHDRGNEPVAMAHCHPGSGPLSVCESSIDVRYMGTIQKVGSKMIGLIVSRGKVFHCRFFTVHQPFTAMVVGKGAREVSENVFEVTHLS